MADSFFGFDTTLPVSCDINKLLVALKLTSFTLKSKITFC